MQLANKLFQRVDFDGVDDPTSTLGDVLLALAIRYDIVFDLDEQAFKEAGYPGKDMTCHRVALPPLPPMKDVPLATVLRAILARIPSSSRATMLFRPGVIEITTRRRAAIEGWKGIRGLVDDFATRARQTEGMDFQLYVEEGIPLLGQINYWRGVMNENARAVLEEAVRATQSDSKETPIIP
jgi:hypothetical protein